MMGTITRSIITAMVIALAIQAVTVGVLAPVLPRFLCRPQVSSSRELSFPDVQRIEIENADGCLDVQTHDSTEVLLRAELKVFPPSVSERATAEKYLESLLDVRVESGTMTLVTEPGERPDLLDIRADYTLLVPPGTDIKIEGANGNVAVAKGCGAVSIAGNNRDILIEEPLGKVRVRSTNGRIRVYDSVGSADLQTVNGTIYAHLLGGALDASTTNGSIVATLRGPDVGACKLTSLNGGVTLVMPETCGARVMARTGSGTIRSDHDVVLDGGIQRRREVHGVIGDGHTELVMTSLNGNIWLAKE